MSTTLMLIDDSLTARMMGRTIVQHVCPEWEVLLAKDGEAALGQLQDGEVAVHRFLIDVNLPGMQGPELADRLHALYPEARMAFMTANTQEYIRQKASDLGMAMIGKPLTQEKFQTLMGVEFAENG